MAGSDDLDDLALLDLLDALVRKSLLVADRSAGRTRFSMLETIRQFALEHLAARRAATEARDAHARYFAGREADVLALRDSPRQREAYTWFATELAILCTAFRWAADQGNLDLAAILASYAAFLGYAIEKLEPISWAEELIEAARAVDHPRLSALYVMASQCHLAGRIKDSLRYTDGGLLVLDSGRYEVPDGIQGLCGGAYLAIGQPERAVEVCRAHLARGRDTHEIASSSLVLALKAAGCGFRPRAGRPAPGLGDRSRHRQPRHRVTPGGHFARTRGRMR